MYWTPAKMELFADVGEYSFANAAAATINMVNWKKKVPLYILET